jgi:prepilin peptidase CpaA
MSWLTWNNWPLIFVGVAMIVAAVIDGWKLKVPNWLTFPLVLSGWLLGVLHDCGLLTGSGQGGIGQGGLGAALAGTALGFALLAPLYAIGGMGAGDVKMQMGFGSWVGAFYGLWTGLAVVFYAFCAAAIIGGVLALVMILVRGQYQTNLANAREIVGDWVGAKSVGEVAEKAAKRKRRLTLLPYGIPLCLGFIGYLIYLNAF